MLKNYLKIAVRSIWKNRHFSLINVFGLACGLMVCFLAIAHIKGSFDYDNFHTNQGSIYRILTEVTTKEHGRATYATSPLPLAETLTDDYGFVENSTRVVRTYGEVQGNAKKLDFLTFAVDAPFFKLFSYPIASGQFPDKPGTAVISKKTAEKLFGKKDPVGQILFQDGLAPSVITGVIAKTNTRSHLQFDILFILPKEKISKLDQGKEWKDFSTGYTYVLLKPEIAPSQLESVLPAIARDKSQFWQLENIQEYRFLAQPLTGISPAKQELINSTYEPQVSGLLVEMGVGIVTLLMAAFNYINLTLARSVSRAREVGIRKSSGAFRWQLLLQFMGESVILSLLALGLAYIMLELIKPMAFVQQWLIGGVIWDWKIWTAFIAFSIITGLLAGLLPAKVLSGFEPALVLRSHSGLKVIRGISLRKILIVTQFSISMIAMVTLVTLMRQQQYMATGYYGFRSKNVLNIPLGSVGYTKLAEEVRKIAGVENVSGISEPFGHHGYTQRIKVNKNDQDSEMTFLFNIGTDFIKTLDLSLVTGKDLPDELDAGNQILINEEAVEKFNLGDNHTAIGKTLCLNDSTEVQIMGVVKNFRFTSFKWKIMPLILRQENESLRYMQVAVTAGSQSAVLTNVRNTWTKLQPYEAFDGKWFNDFLYERHAHMEDITFMALLLGISFSIACLGLLGMVTYTVQIRRKEVGVRKIMGANVKQIMWLLSRDFTKLLTIAAALALPLGYMAGYAFLSNFAYHVSIGVETLGLCFGVLLVAGGLFICIRTYKPATENPVKALANE